jgi:hypothetical protein
MTAREAGARLPVAEFCFCPCPRCRSREAAPRLLGWTAEGVVRPGLSREGEDGSRIDFSLEPNNARADRQLTLGPASFRVHADDQVLDVRLSGEPMGTSAQPRRRPRLLAPRPPSTVVATALDRVQQLLKVEAPGVERGSGHYRGECGSDPEQRLAAALRGGGHPEGREVT